MTETPKANFSYAGFAFFILFAVVLVVLLSQLAR